MYMNKRKEFQLMFYKIISLPPAYSDGLSFGSVCVSICVSVWVISFKAVNMETSIMVWWYILSYLGQVCVSRLLGQSQGHKVKNAIYPVTV